MGEHDLASGQGQVLLQKKRYDKPALQTLGSLTELTQNLGTMTTSDGAAKGSTKTA